MTTVDFAQGPTRSGFGNQLEVFQPMVNLADPSCEYLPWLFLPSRPGAPASVVHDFSGWVSLPPVTASAPSSLPQLIRQIREYTGWSQRDLATVLLISHTTVRKLESDGRVTPRSRAAATRVAPIHDLVRRLAAAAGHNPRRVATALSTPDQRDGRPVDLMAAGEFALAYVAALRALRGSPTGMLAPTGDRTALDATVELR